MADNYLYPHAGEIDAAVKGLSSTASAAYRGQILDDAAWLRSLEPPSVVRQSSDRPRPTRNPHDYVSIGTYWWPNPDTTDGLPWVHRDGKYSPALDQYDRLSWDLHCDGLSIFALAQQLSDDCTSSIRDWLETWYIDLSTRMNPHLRYAQFCPGHNDGRMVGCIDFTIRLPRFLEIFRRLEATPNLLPKALVGGVNQWWNEFLDWLISPEVRDWHAAAENNIGVFYDRSVIYLALWLGREAVADELLRRVPAGRIQRQIEADGRLPHELKRTRSFDYTLMTVLGFIDLASLGDSRGMDLWTSAEQDSGSVESAIDWVWVQAAGDAPWPAAQIGPVEWSRLVRLWWCLPSRYREKYPLDAIASRLEEPLRAEPAAELLSFRLHPFHQPIWESFPQHFPEKQGGPSHP